MDVPFIDLSKTQARVGREFNAALRRLQSRCDFILGDDVRQFETEFAAYAGTRSAVGLNSGTDALFLSLKALGVGPGDEVIVPSFTFIATAFAVSYCGATPVFCDIDPATFCIDPQSAENAVTPRTKAIIPVHLFGQCCDMGKIMRLARKRKLKVVEDACQSHGAVYNGVKAGAIGDAGCFSFYPTKNLGGWGDGGLVTSSDAGLVKQLLLLRDCGRKSRYEHAVVGHNSRLDTCQAALLRVKLPLLDGWNAVRAEKAALYGRLLSGIGEVSCPVTAPYSNHVFHVYAVLCRERDALAGFLREQGIGTVVNYPLPLHLQEAYASRKWKKGSLPVSERTCRDVLSLPMHPYITDAQVRYVCAAVKRFYAKRAGAVR